MKWLPYADQILSRTNSINTSYQFICGSRDSRIGGLSVTKRISEEDMIAFEGETGVLEEAYN